MGAVTFSIDTKIVEMIQQKYHFDIFVETGTFEGTTIEKICSLFSQIYTIELDQKYYKAAQEKFCHLSHVHVQHDHSPNALRKLKPILKNEKVLYWFDAHCLESPQQEQDYAQQCPLLEELKSINLLNSESIIMIDDARLFLAPPTFNQAYPYAYKFWPKITTIIDHLHQLSDFHEITILDDVIIFYPNHMSDFIIEYGHKYSVDWAWVYDKAQRFSELTEKEQVIQAQHQSLQLLQQQLIEKEQVIQAQHQSLQLLQQQLIEKEQVIQAQHQSLQLLQMEKHSQN